MNPPPSKPRSSEAERLESDYLERLHEVLRPLPATEAAEIEENVTGHIYEALAELDTEEVGLSHMAAVLEELGPPDAMIAEISEGDPAASPFSELPKASPETMETIQGSPSSPPPPPVEGTEFLDRLFAGYLIVTIGLFIPLIEVYFCSIIGYAVILWNLPKAPVPEIARAKPWALIAIFSALAMCPAALLTLAEQGFGILFLPIGLAWAVSDIALLWIIFGGLANWAEGKGMAAMAGGLRNRRIYYIVAYLFLVLLAIPVGIAISGSGRSLASSLAGYALLPISWIINWFLILKPIRVLRGDLR